MVSFLKLMVASKGQLLLIPTCNLPSGSETEASQGNFDFIDQFYQWCLIMQHVPLELSPTAVFLAAFSVPPAVEYSSQNRLTIKMMARE